MSRMLFVCDKCHESIVHTESRCPLCKVKAELDAANEMIEALEEERRIPLHAGAILTGIRL